jgi:predicted dehydrogenase
MRYLVGSEVARLYAAIAERPDGTTSYAITFRFASGAVGTMSLFGGTHTLMMETGITGSSGRAIEVEEAARLTYYKEAPALGAGGYVDSPSMSWHQGNLYRGYARPGYLEELRHFAEALLAGEQPRASLHDAWQDMRILEAVIESHAQGKEIALEA